MINLTKEQKIKLLEDLGLNYDELIIEVKETKDEYILECVGKTYSPS